MLPLPSNPSPPELLMALARRHPAAQMIPACTMGYSILKSRVMRFSNMFNMKLDNLKIENEDKLCETICQQEI